MARAGILTALDRKKFPYLQRFTRTLKNGRQIPYIYHRPTKQRIYSTPGTPAFAAEYAAMRAGHAPPNPARKCFVYFLRAEGLGFIKIGKTTSMRKRIKSLQAASPVALTLIGAITDPGGGALEGVLHNRFAQHRVRGEWFSPHADIHAWIAENATEATIVRGRMKATAFVTGEALAERNRRLDEGC